MLDIEHLATASGAGGSFWQAHLDKSQKALSNHMALMSNASKTINTLRTGCAGWTNEDTRTAGPLVLSNDEFLLLSLGGGLNQWEPEPGNLAQWHASRRTQTGWHAVGLGDALENPLFGSDLIPLLLEFTADEEDNRNSQPVFLFLVPEKYTVLTVIGKERLLHAGIHFESRPGVMIFRDHPERWMPHGPNFVKMALETGPLTSDYVLSADVRANHDVTNYYRQLATPGTLLKAACGAAGLVQVKESGVVASVVEKPGNGRLYVLEAGSSIDVPYDHEVLSVGTTLAADSYIGANPQVCNTDGIWWTDAPWGLGVDLSEITPWNLFAPNAPVLVEAYGTAPNLHVRFYLQGNHDIRTQWWAACAAGDPGHVLAGLLGLTVSGQTVLLNPLWVFAAYVWQVTALVVNLNASGLADKMRERMSSFLKRERPLGKLLLVLDPQQQ